MPVMGRTLSASKSRTYDHVDSRHDHNPGHGRADSVHAFNTHERTADKYVARTAKPVKVGGRPSTLVNTRQSGTRDSLAHLGDKVSYPLTWTGAALCE